MKTGYFLRHNRELNRAIREIFLLIRDTEILAHSAVYPLVTRVPAGAD
jgi:hypothetical protein